MRRAVLWSVAVGAILTLAQTSGAQRDAELPRDLRFSYAVKFVCGRQPLTGTVHQGVYQTRINVHNPSLANEVRFVKKVAQALSGQQPGGVSEFISEKLGPNQAFGMDCADIFPLTAGFPAEGFVVILTPVEMDVVAVYTAGPFEGAVSTMDVERVPSRRLPPPTLTPGSNRPGGRP